MLMVTVCFDRSGNSRTRSPLTNRYSVIPSTEVTRATPSGNAGAEVAGACANTAGPPRVIESAAKPSKHASRTARGSRALWLGIDLMAFLRNKFFIPHSASQNCDIERGRTAFSVTRSPRVGRAATEQLVTPELALLVGLTTPSTDMRPS